MDAQKLLSWLDEICEDTADYGWQPEHVDGLIRIGKHMIELRLAGDGIELAEDLEELEDYFEQWGAHCDLADAFAVKCRKYLV
jgi:hypothetical protein